MISLYNYANHRLALECSGKDSPDAFALLSFVCVRKIFVNKLSWFQHSYATKSGYLQ